MRLVAEADGILDGSRPGSDARALHELLAANALSPNTFEQQLYSAAVKTFDTLKLIDTARAIPGAAFSPAAAFSPRGDRFVTAGDHGILRMWDTQTGQQVGKDFVGHTKWVNDAVFSPDGHRLATTSDDRTVRLWNADTGEPIGRPMTGHEDEVWGVAFSPDGLMIATGSVDTNVRLWNAKTGQPIGQPIDHPAKIVCVEFSPDGRRIVTGGYDGAVRIWDVGTGQQIGPPHKVREDDKTEIIMDVAFSPDGRRLASAGADGDVQIWDGQTGLPIGGPLTGHGTQVMSVAFSPDGHRLATGGNDGAVRLWDVDTSQLLGAPMLGHKSAVFTLSFNPDGTHLLSGSQDGTIRLWDVGIRRPLFGHIGGVSSVAVSPDGHRIASAGDDGTVRLWNADNGHPMGKPLVASGQPLSSVVFSPDGRRLATAGADGTVRMWDADTGTPVGAPINPGQGPLTSVAFSPDGRRRSVTRRWAHSVRLWDVETGSPIGEPRIHGELVHSVAFSPDGNRIVSGGMEAGYNGTVRLWDANTGQLIRAVPIGGADVVVFAVAYRPDGRRIAAAGGDGVIQRLDAGSLDKVGEPMQAHEDTVVALAYSPDGRTLASASLDETIRVWDVESGKQAADALTGAHRRRGQCCVQSRWPAHSFGQHGRYCPGLAGRCRSKRSVRQAHCEYEPQTVERMGIAGHRLHQGLPRSADPSRLDMSRIFLSHSSLDAREALALKRWLVDQEPPLATDIFLDIDPEVGLRPGERWKDRLQQASAKCEAVVCLLSKNWEASHECKTEYRVAENLNKQILCARLEPSAGDDLTSEWQRCDLFGESDMTSIDVGGGPPVMFATSGLYRLRDAIRGTGISAHSFVWPPPDDVDRAPYRGWEPFEQVDAAVFFGRDAAIVHGLDELRGMRVAETKSLFVVLGPSGTGKSSFLRAGLLPRLAREDRRFTFWASCGPVATRSPGTPASQRPFGTLVTSWAYRHQASGKSRPRARTTSSESASC